jgi:peptidoglycan/xylan/chitin deacetylase (PgdA/CDA1 family)
MLDLFFPQILLGKTQRRLFRNGTPMFCYHHVGVPPNLCQDPFLYVDPRIFERQLGALRQAGFSSADLDDLVQSGKPLLDSAIITFDDGYDSVFRNAMEPLSKHGFHAIQYIVADLIGKQNEWDMKRGHAPAAIMDASQIREWIAAGHSIGSHTLTHRNLTRLTPAEAREQIAGSKKKLEDIFQMEIRHFCYPHGRWNESLRDLVEEAGYQTACTTIFGVNSLQTSLLELRRVFPLSEGELIAKAIHRIRTRIRTRLGGR